MTMSMQSEVDLVCPYCGCADGSHSWVDFQSLIDEEFRRDGYRCLDCELWCLFIRSKNIKAETLSRKRRARKRLGLEW